MRVLKLDRRGRLRLSEGEVAQQHRDFLEQHGWMVHPLHAERNFKHAADRRERTGCADYICACPFIGVFYLEMKRRGGKLRPAQVDFQLYMLKRGFTYVVSDDFDEFCKWYFKWIQEAR